MLSLLRSLKSICRSNPLWAARLKRLWPFQKDDRLGIHNNATEQGMRSIELGQANCLFIGSDNCGNSVAIAYTLIEAAKLNGVDPQTRLIDILGRIVDQKINRVDDLLPWRYAEQSSAKAQAGHSLSIGTTVNYWPNRLLVTLRAVLMMIETSSQAWSNSALHSPCYSSRPQL